MKRILGIVIVSLGLCLSARAELHQVTQLNATTTKQIIIPGTKATVIIIQNIGANAVNLSIDGGSSAGGQDPGTGATGNGMVLPAASSGIPGTVVFYGPWFTGVIISGVTQAGTTTLNVITNAPAGNSVFNTN